MNITFYKIKKKAAKQIITNQKERKNLSKNREDQLERVIRNCNKRIKEIREERKKK